VNRVARAAGQAFATGRMIGIMVLLRRSQLIMSRIAYSVAPDTREADAEGNARMSHYFNPVGVSRHKDQIPALPLGLSNVRVYASDEVPEQQRHAATWPTPQTYIGKPLYGQLVHWSRRRGPAGIAYHGFRLPQRAACAPAKPGAVA
jgi:hypothetical protein